jgi:hypothetical protein
MSIDDPTILLQLKEELQKSTDDLEKAMGHQTEGR